MTPGSDPLELTPVRPVRRASFIAPHSTPGTKGGQGRSAAELERSAVEFAAPWLIAGLAIGASIAAVIWMHT